MAETLPPVIAVFEGDAEELFATIDDIEARLEELADVPTTVDFDGNDDLFNETYDSVEGRLDTLDATVAMPDVGLDDALFDATDAQVEAVLEALDEQVAMPSVGLNDTDLLATAAADQAILDELDAQQITIDGTLSAASVDELTESLAGADVASTDLMGSLGALEPILATSAGEFDGLASSAQAAAVSIDEVAASADAAAGEEGLDALLQSVDDVGASTDEMAESFDAAQISVLEIIDAAEDAGLVFDSLDDLTNQLGLDLSLGAQDAEEFGEALSIALGNAVEAAAAGVPEIEDFSVGLSDAAAALLNSMLGAEAFDGAAAVLTSTLQDLDEGVIDTATAIADLEETGMDAEMALQLVEGASNDVTEAVLDFEYAILDAWGAVQDLEGALADGEGAINDITTALNDAGEAGGGFISMINSGFSSIGEFVTDISFMDVMIGLLVAALIAAIPVVGAFIGEIGALSAIAFTAFAGVGAAVLAMIPDFGQLETAAKAALKSYEQALAPFSQKVVNDAIPLITQALQALIPIAEAADEAIGPLLSQLSADMDSAGFKQFIEWVTNNTGPAIDSLANFGLSVIETLSEMGEQGQPFIDMIERGLDQFGQDLAKFGNSNTFKDFVNWLVTNGPTIGEDIEEIGKSFGKIFVALTPAGMSLLSDFTSGMKIIAEIAGPVATGLREFSKGFDELSQHMGIGGTFLLSLVDPLELVQLGIDGVKDVLPGLESTWDSVWSGAKSTFDTVWSGLKSDLAEPIWQGIEAAVHTLESTWDTVWSGVKSTFDTVWSGLKSDLAEPIWQGIEAAVHTLESTWDTVWSGVKSTFDTVWSGLKSDLAEPIFNSFESVIHTVESTWDTVWSGIESAFDTTWGFIKSDLAEPIFSGVVSTVGALESTWDTVWDGMKGTFDTVWGFIKSDLADPIFSAVTTAVDTLKSTWDTTWDTVKSTLSTVWSVIGPILSAVEKAIDGIVSAAGKIGSVISDVTHLGNVASSVGGVIGKGLSVIGLAEGGEVTSPTLAIVGEAGPELVIPKSQLNGALTDGSGVQPLPEIGTAPATGATAGGTAGGLSISFGDIHVDGSSGSIEQVADQVRTLFLKQARAYGSKGGVMGKYAGTR